jgi:hypothetical protein
MSCTVLCSVDSLPSTISVLLHMLTHTSKSRRQAAIEMEEKTVGKSMSTIKRTIGVSYLLAQLLKLYLLYL